MMRLGLAQMAGVLGALNKELPCCRLIIRCNCFHVRMEIKLQGD